VSFIPKRHITDNVVVMQEILHMMRHKKCAKGLMAIKIDFEKAYDQIHWSFINDTLQKVRLLATLVEVIYGCISTCTMSVLWNSPPMDFFRPTWGIQQGDPLSPDLFVMCMERLVHVVESMVAQRRLKPVTVGRGAPQYQIYY